MGIFHLLYGDTGTTHECRGFLNAIDVSSCFRTVVGQSCKECVLGGRSNGALDLCKCCIDSSEHFLRAAEALCMVECRADSIQGLHDWAKFCVEEVLLHCGHRLSVVHRGAGTLDIDE